MKKILVLGAVSLALFGCNEKKEEVKKAPEPKKEVAAPAPAVEVYVADAKTVEQYKTACAICHNYDTRLVGPPIKEIQEIYKGNPDGVVAWAKAPGKKREDYPQMPPQALPDSELKALAQYMLSITK